jgi:hypothetical protein
MKNTSRIVALLFGVLLLSVPFWPACSCSAQATQEKNDKKDPEKRSGVVIGIITAREAPEKGAVFIEVKADGEEKARRYVPQWRGGLPNQGGGPDKEIAKAIRAVKVGNRVRVEWEFDERPRVIKLEVLQRPGEKAKPPKEQPKEEEVKSGTVVGTLADKMPNYIEIKADGEEKARRYLFFRGGTPELRRAINDTPLGSRVRVEWRFLEHLRVMNIEVLKRAG